MRKLHRFDEARQEIRRAIECHQQFGHVAEPWAAWAILAEIETADGNSNAAVEAKQNATAYYLAYRRDGGENHSDPGRLCLAVTERLLAVAPAAAAPLIEEQASRFAASVSMASSKPSKPSLQAAATATSPTPRVWTFRWPPRSSSCSKRWRKPESEVPPDSLL